jgi:hypothetical protein
MIYGTFFTITADNVSTTMGYAGGLISDLTPLLLPIVGVFLGLMIFWAITGAIKK